MNSNVLKSNVCGNIALGFCTLNTNLFSLLLLAAISQNKLYSITKNCEILWKIIRIAQDNQQNKEIMFLL